jgi:hypothetical protein
MVPRRIFLPRRNEVTQGWRKLHNEDRYNLCTYYSKRIIRMIKSRTMLCAGSVARTGRGGEDKNAYISLVRNPEGKSPLGRPRCKWVNNIKIALRETGWSNIDCIDLAHDRYQWRALVNMVINLRDAQNAGKFLAASREGLSSMELVKRLAM